MARSLKIPWHEAFSQCYSPHSDAPLNFITWGAISLLGAALKDNVFFEIGTYTLYPNQFIVLVSPPGIGKGTTMDIVEKIIEEFASPLVNTLSDRITAEAIIEEIANGWAKAPSMSGQQLIVGAKDHSCLLLSSELRVLLGSSEWMLEFLEEAWSKRTYKRKTRHSGSASIVEMCTSLLAASVPDFLRNINREIRMAIAGGFSSRCLFIYAENTSKDLPWPVYFKKDPKSKAIYDNLVADLADIATMRGEFKVTAGARILFENFLKQNKASVILEDPEAVANFKARIKAHTLKLAMILSASRSSSLVIDDLDMQNAIVEIMKVRTTLERLFRGAGDSPDAAAASRVQSLIEKHGMLSKKEILRVLGRHMTSETLDRILYVMEFTGICIKQEQNRTTYYKQAVNGTAAAAKAAQTKQPPVVVLPNGGVKP